MVSVTWLVGLEDITTNYFIIPESNITMVVQVDPAFFNIGPAPFFIMGKLDLLIHDCFPHLPDPRKVMNSCWFYVNLIQYGVGLKRCNKNRSNSLSIVNSPLNNAIQKKYLGLQRVHRINLSRKVEGKAL